MTRCSPSGSGDHSGDCGGVTTGKSTGEVQSPWRLWWCDPRYRVWEVCHPRGPGGVTSGAGSGRGGYYVN